MTLEKGLWSFWVVYDQLTVWAFLYPFSDRKLTKETICFSQIPPSISQRSERIWQRFFEGMVSQIMYWITSSNSTAPHYAEPTPVAPFP